MRKLNLTIIIVSFLLIHDPKIKLHINIHYTKQLNLKQWIILINIAELKLLRLLQ